MRRKHYRSLDPDEVFLDSRNLPSFDNQQFEGRIEQPISKSVLVVVSLLIATILLILFGQVVNLQAFQGDNFRLRSESNTLRHTPLFPERGVIYDRNGEELAWNNPDRHYASSTGLAHVLGYISYPNEEELSTGDYFPTEYLGRAGVERSFNDLLRGQVGVQIEEVDVRGELTSDYLLATPEDGKDLTLSIDRSVQSQLYKLIKQTAEERGFTGGAGVIINAQTGELLALTSYPEYDSNFISGGAEPETLQRYFNDQRKPFLDRALVGLYTPGSIVKPIMALGALTEKIITPEKEIVSTGALKLPNPFVPGEFSVFKDWKAHGATDMRRAIAVSSDVYFYQIGGGFEDQPGLGIDRIDKYAQLFGLGSATGLEVLKEESGNIPTREWKAATFPDDPTWRIGNTYHTVIGQYGFQVTPIQMARAVAGIATGKLLTPQILASSTPKVAVDITKTISPQDFKVVREGMRLSVIEGTAAALSIPAVAVAGKTGTAELGTTKKEVNSWVVGYFPYEAPRYAFAVVMEKGSSLNLIGSSSVMRQLLDWLTIYAPEYLTTTP